MIFQTLDKKKKGRFEHVVCLPAFWTFYWHACLAFPNCRVCLTHSHSWLFTHTQRERESPTCRKQVYRFTTLFCLPWIVSIHIHTHTSVSTYTHQVLEYGCTVFTCAAVPIYTVCGLLAGFRQNIMAINVGRAGQSGEISVSWGDCPGKTRQGAYNWGS